MPAPEKTCYSADAGRILHTLSTESTKKEKRSKKEKKYCCYCFFKKKNILTGRVL